jgi:UDP-N-acetylglucosamine 2-epimerase
MLSGNDPFDVLATYLAKSYNIPTLFIPHALISKRRDFVALEQDYIVCAGKRDSDYYMSLGTLQDKIRILGIPLYDKAYEEITKIKSEEKVKEFIKIKFNLRPKNRIILLVTTFHEDHIRAKIFKSVVNAVQDLKDCQLMVKLHPIETGEFYRRIIFQEGFNDILLIQEKILHKLIIASDLVIGSISGAQIEALLLGKNVINLIYERLSDPLLMDKYNAAFTVFNPNQLKEAITKCLYDQEIQKLLHDGRKQYIEYCLYKFDGNSSFRVFDLINEILGY